MGSLLLMYGVLQRPGQYRVCVAQHVGRHAGHGAGELARLKPVLGYPVELFGSGC